MGNRVHELQQKLAEAVSGKASWRIDDQTDWYAAMTAARQALAWTIAQAEEKIGLAERHLSKIETARAKDWKAKAYLRLPLRFSMTNTARWMMAAYGLELRIVPVAVGALLDDLAPALSPRLTTAQRRALNIPGDQLELPLPSPVRRVSVARVEAEVKSRKARAKLKEAA